MVLIIIFINGILELSGQSEPYLKMVNESGSIKSTCYRGLEKEIIHYEAIEKKGGWNKTKTLKKVLKLGDSSEIVKNIRKRLMITGETSSSDTTMVFDKELEKDIIGYQNRNGLKPDGRAGIETLKAMNISVQDRIQQLKLNLERCLQLPDEFGEKYILVNIPAFELVAMKKGMPVFYSKIVAGKESDKTAIFKGTMSYVVFAPYWNVPKSIMHKEILPAIAKNPNYLKENNMEWYDGKIRQKPGPWNALGGVKFIFPNAYNMYMHDTPAKTLFNENSRAFSHGCIRVEQPIKMALYLLEEQNEWNIDSVTTAMRLEHETTVVLKEKTGVHILYFTAFIDERGNLNFRKDIYGKDQYLLY